MELLVDTAKLEDIATACEYFPISGVTCNPSIVKKSANPDDFFDHVRKIRAIIGKERTLHVQVVGTDSDTMMAEAKALHQGPGHQRRTEDHYQTEKGRLQCNRNRRL